jgi:3-keto-disaccharide hydrolase/NHL repeat-containing protein
VVDEGNSNLRKITPAGAVSTVAGAASGTSRLAAPRGVATDDSGNVYVADTDNHCIRRITAAGVISTLAGQVSRVGRIDGVGYAALFREPRGIAVGPSGDLYVADTGNGAIRRIAAGGMVTTIALASESEAPAVSPQPAAFVPAPAPVVPPRHGESELSDFSHAQTLQGWEADPTFWSVNEGVFTAKGERVPSNFLLTEKSYSDFRLTLWSRVVESENHAGVCFWGERTISSNGRNRWAYKGPLVIFPGLSLWDYNTNKDIPIDPAAKAFARTITSQHAWIHVEILAQSNRIRVAYNGRQVLDWREPNPSRLKSGPIGLQLHGYVKPQEVVYKEIVIEAFPKEDRLITIQQ